MNKRCLLFLLLMGLLQGAYSHELIPGKIVIYREYNSHEASIWYKVFANDSLIIKLKNNSSFVYNCTPGDYDLTVDKCWDTRLHLKVEEGKTYYVRFSFNKEFTIASPELSVVDSVLAYPSLQKGGMTKFDKVETRVMRPKNRIGVNFGFGIGFDDFTMVQTIGGIDSKIAFGGGVALGVTYGYELFRYLDLAMDFNYQVSSLYPDIKNADVFFRRACVSVTPSLIIPIRDGELWRIKLGAGADYYLGSVLSIETNHLSGGFNDDWKYKNTFGYHVSAILEWNLSPTWLINYGMKWYNVSYDFKSGGHYYPTNGLAHPDGSGLNFVVGSYFNF